MPRPAATPTSRLVFVAQEFGGQADLGLHDDPAQADTPVFKRDGTFGGQLLHDVLNVRPLAGVPPEAEIAVVPGAFVDARYVAKGQVGGSSHRLGLLHSGLHGHFPRPVLELAQVGHGELDAIHRLPTSLNKALDALEADPGYLLEDGVFTEDLLEAWVQIKRKEVSEIRVRPTPYEFEMYYDVSPPGSFLLRILKGVGIKMGMDDFTNMLQKKLYQVLERPNIGFDVRTRTPRTDGQQRIFKGILANDA